MSAALERDCVGDRMSTVNEPSLSVKDSRSKGIAILLACGIAAMLLPVRAGRAEEIRDRTELSFEHRSSEAGQSQSRPGRASAEANKVTLPLPSANRETAAPSLPSVDGKSRWWTSLGSLALVLALIVLAARLFQTRSGSGNLPRGVVEVVGRCPLDGRQSLYVVRWGDRLLLIGGGPNGAHTLAELSDCEEVRRITALCDSRPKWSLPGALLGVRSETLGTSQPATTGASSQEAT